MFGSMVFFSKSSHSHWILLLKSHAGLLAYLHRENWLEMLGSGLLAADSEDNEQTLVSWCKSGDCAKYEKVKVLKCVWKS